MARSAQQCPRFIRARLAMLMRMMCLVLPRALSPASAATAHVSSLVRRSSSVTFVELKPAQAEFPAQSTSLIGRACETEENEVLGHGEERSNVQVNAAGKAVIAIVKLGQRTRASNVG
jgi:ABC-type transporter MlaC component